MVGATGEDKVLEAPFDSPDNPLKRELSEILSGGYHTTSSSYRQLNRDIVFAIDVDDGAYMVTVHGMIESVGGDATTRRF